MMTLVQAMEVAIDACETRARRTLRTASRDRYIEAARVLRERLVTRRGCELQGCACGVTPMERKPHA
jgi:hypothetical protein